ncbi:MAG: nitrous oxide-stimulated promoter family protein [Raoultibacter sp.]
MAEITKNTPQETAQDTPQDTPQGVVQGSAKSTAKSTPQDTPKAARRRQREKKTVSQMVALHCAGKHEAATRTAVAYCGQPLCPDCARLDAYVVQRTEKCRKMEVKTSCAACENHCYNPTAQEEIRAIMRYAGPRMLTVHPAAALRHLLHI